MTVVKTRRVWRDVLGNGTYYDIVHLDGVKARGAKRGAETKVRFYEVAYIDPACDFNILEAHTELGGYGMALREGAVYSLFTEQDGPGFSDLWPDVTYHLVVSITEVDDGHTAGQIDRT